MPAGGGRPGNSSVRIIGGHWRGRRIGVPARPGLRPSPDRVRETLFNWLAPVIHGARCLDLFAGTGVLGLEALSRGAASVVFVERDGVAAEALEQAIDRLDAANAAVTRADAMDWLARPRGPFDIVFVDPPFDSGLLAGCARRIAEYVSLPDAARIYLEMRRGQQPALPEAWRVLRDKRAGDVRYCLCRPGAPIPEPPR